MNGKARGGVKPKGAGSSIAPTNNTHFARMGATLSALFKKKDISPQEYMNVYT